MHPNRIATLTLICLAAPLQGAEVVLVGRDVPAERRVPLGQVGHAPWTELLRRHVDDRGRVDYRGWKASADDLAKLDLYLDTLSTGDPTAPATTAEKVAFWSNAYNAVTVKGILREYPTTSIRNHTAKLWGYNIWKHLRLTVGGEPISLNDIEHEVLRKLGEPRIHFAIVCASIGCPRLLNEAYTAERLDGQLDSNARHFFSQPQNLRVDRGANRILLSAILDWFAEDFGDSDAERLRYVSRFVEDEPTRRFLIEGAPSVGHLKYDWGLNEQ